MEYNPAYKVPYLLFDQKSYLLVTEELQSLGPYK